MAAWTRLILLCIAIAAGAALPTAARAEQRLAFVVGNSGYAKAPLRNPENDARLVAERLRQLGFEVMEHRNLGQKEMKRAVAGFAERIRNAKGDAVALLFYAGHGLQVQGTNYLVPTDAEIRSESDVAIDAVRVDDILASISEAQPRTTILILDACRDNPFARGFRSLHRGLAEMKARPGTLIAYSTAPGDTAADGDSENSPYSAALARVIGEPGTDIERVFKKVRISVHESTNGQQTPWESSSLTSDFRFVPDGPNAAQPQTPKAAQPQTLPPSAPADPGKLAELEAEAAYRDALAKNTPEAYEILLRRFPGHPRREAINKLIMRGYDQRMWDKVRGQDTLLGYEQYKIAFPDGIYVADADRRIAALHGPTVEPAPAPAVTPAPFTPVPTRAERRIDRRPGIDFYGGDYRFVTDVEPETCEQVCRNEARCRGYTYNRAARRCFLKDGSWREQAFANAVSGVVRQGSEDGPGRRAGRPVAAEIRTGIDLPGGDYEMLQESTLESCEGACVGDRRCRAFTYNSRANVCFLKQSVGAEVRHQDAMSAVVREPTGTVPGAMTVFPATDFPGHDYRDVRWISLDDCRNSCMGDGRCKAFAYHAAKQWCFLKTGASRTVHNPATYGGVRN